METVARDLRTRLNMLAVTVGWHRFGYPDGAFSSEEKKHGIHGGDIETSLMLAAKPDTVRMDQAPKATPETVAMAAEFKWLGAYRPAGFAWMTQDLHPSGAVGDATLATRGQGRRGAGSAARKPSSNCCARSTASILRACATGRSINNSPPPRKWGRGTARLRGGRGAGLDALSAMTTKRRVRGPLHHASHGPPPPLRGGGQSNPVLAARLSARGLPKPRSNEFSPERKREVQRREAPKSWPRHAGECCHSLALRARRAPQDNPLARTACFGRAAPPGAPPRFLRPGGRPASA